MTLNPRLVALSLAAFSLLATPVAHAARHCRQTPDVVQSASSLKDNAAAGGHVFIYVKGQMTGAGKPQFKDEASFQAAWAMWQEYSGGKGPGPKECVDAPSPAAMDCVPAKVIGIDSPGKGYLCDAVDNKGLCTKGHDFTPVSVAFRYVKNNKGAWILDTAYPARTENCN